MLSEHATSTRTHNTVIRGALGARCPTPSHCPIRNKADRQEVGAGRKGQAGPKGARTNDRRRGCACASDAGRVVCNARQMGRRRVRRQVVKSAATGGGARPLLTRTQMLTPFSGSGVSKLCCIRMAGGSADATTGLDKYLPCCVQMRERPILMQCAGVPDTGNSLRESGKELRVSAS